MTSDVLYSLLYRIDKALIFILKMFYKTSKSKLYKSCVFKISVWFMQK